jgi:hypothetical protein
MDGWTKLAFSIGLMMAFSSLLPFLSELLSTRWRRRTSSGLRLEITGSDGRRIEFVLPGEQGSPMSEGQIKDLVSKLDLVGHGTPQTAKD